MTWPEDSKHYIDIRAREDAENPTLSYGSTCRDQYRRDFGKEYEGEYEGEIEYAALTN